MKMAILNSFSVCVWPSEEGQLSQNDSHQHSILPRAEERRGCSDSGGHCDLVGCSFRAVGNVPKTPLRVATFAHVGRGKSGPDRDRPRRRLPGSWMPTMASRHNFFLSSSATRRLRLTCPQTRTSCRRPSKQLTKDRRHAARGRSHWQPPPANRTATQRAAGHTSWPWHPLSPLASQLSPRRTPRQPKSVAHRRTLSMKLGPVSPKGG